MGQNELCKRNRKLIRYIWSGNLQRRLSQLAIQSQKVLVKSMQHVNAFSDQGCCYMNGVLGIKVSVAPYKIASKFGRSSIHVDDTDELLFKKTLDDLFLALRQ